MKKLCKILRNCEVPLSLYTIHRVVKGLVRARLFRKNTLRAIELYPTFACQMKCNMCSVERYKTDSSYKRTLSMDDYSKLAKEGAKLGATTLIILGGEPTLFQKLFLLIDVFCKKNYFVHMVSNGMNLEQTYIRRLKQSGLDSLFLSLESMSEEANDSIRGAGHFQQTMRNISWCRDEGLEVGLAPVFFSDHIDQALEVIAFCYKEGLRASGGQVAPVGKAVDTTLLSAEEINCIRKAVEQYPNFVFDWSFSYFGGIRCPAGKEKVGVTMYGDVIPCSYNPIGFGNILDESLKGILKRMGSFSQFKKDYRGCLCSEDPFYIEKYLRPASAAISYPVNYKNHPEITPKKEPGVFSTSAL